MVIHTRLHRYESTEYKFFFSPFSRIIRTHNTYVVPTYARPTKGRQAQSYISSVESSCIRGFSIFPPCFFFLCFVVVRCFEKLRLLPLAQKKRDTNKNPPSTFDHSRPRAISLPNSREFNAEGLTLTVILVYLSFVPALLEKKNEARPGNQKWRWQPGFDAACVGWMRLTETEKRHGGGERIFNKSSRAESLFYKKKRRK